MKILFIDEDRSLQQALKSVFIERGHDFYSALSSRAGLELIQKEAPHIILLDFLLPGEDGFDFLQKLKTDPETKDIPVIALTNLGGEDDRKRALSLGVVDFMTKANYSLVEVVFKVEELLNKKVGNSNGLI